jgi:hypothetical protein
VKNTFEISFNNSVFTDISINVTGIGSRTIMPGAKATFSFNANPGQVVYSASTAGKTTQGGQVGLLMVWNETLNVASKSSEAINLIIGPAYFFLYLKNLGISRLTPLYVNYGTVEQTQVSLSPTIMSPIILAITRLLPIPKYACIRNSHRNLTYFGKTGRILRFPIRTTRRLHS